MCLLAGTSVGTKVRLTLTVALITQWMGTAKSCKGGGQRRWESNPMKADDGESVDREKIHKSSLPHSLQNLGQLLSATRDKLNFKSSLPTDQKRLFLPYVKGVVGSPRDTLTKTRWKDIGISFLPYLYRISDFLQGSVKYKTKMVDKAISESFCRVCTIITLIRGFLEKTFPFLRIGIAQRTRKLLLSMKKEMGENIEASLEGQMGREMPILPLAALNQGPQPSMKPVSPLEPIPGFHSSKGHSP